MTTMPNGKPFAWSYSALTAFEQCPWRYFLTKVVKRVDEPQTPQTTWGNRVHKAMELRVGSGQPLPGNMIQWEPLAASVVAKRETGAKIAVEQKMAITRSFAPTTYFGKDCWSRAVADVMIEKGDKMAVLDWKTGKAKPDSQQLQLSAAFVFHVKPYINEVSNSFIWMKGDAPPTVEKFTRDDLPRIWQEFAPRVERVEEAIQYDKFPKRPSGLCKEYCPVTKRNCEYCGG